MPGHPDFQDTVSWLGEAFASADDETIAAGNLQVGPFVMGHYQGVLVGVRPSVNDVRVEVQFAALGVPDQPTASFVAYVNAGDRATWVEPARGDVLEQVLITPSAYPTDVDYFVAPTNVPGWRTLSVDDSILAHREGDAIAAAASETVTLPFYFGPAKLVFNAAGGGPYTLAARSLDHTGAVIARPLSAFGIVANTGYNEPFVLPAGLNEVIVINAGGASAYNLTVIAELGT